MDKCGIRTLPYNSSHFQFDKKAFHKSRRWIWSSIYAIPQGCSKGPFLWTSWYYIFLLSSTNFTIPLGLPLPCIHHFSKPGQHFFGCLFWYLSISGPFFFFFFPELILCHKCVSTLLPSTNQKKGEMIYLPAPPNGLCFWVELYNSWHGNKDLWPNDENSEVLSLLHPFFIIKLGIN